MIPYIILYSLFIIFYLITKNNIFFRYSRKHMILICLIPLTIFSLLYSGHIGTDLSSYNDEYNLNKESTLEPGFVILINFANKLGLNYITFTKILAIIQILLLYKISLKLNEYDFFILFYFSNFYLNFNFNIIRNSLALLILGATYVNSLKPRYITYILAISIHFSSIFVILLELLTNLKIKSKIITILLLIIFVYLFNHMGYINSNFYLNYLGKTVFTKNFYPALLIKFTIASLIFMNGGNGLYFTIYFILVVLVHLLDPIISRFSDIVLFMYIINYLRYNCLCKYYKFIVILTFILMISSFLIPLNDFYNNDGKFWYIYNN